MRLERLIELAPYALLGFGLYFAIEGTVALRDWLANRRKQNRHGNQRGMRRTIILLDLAEQHKSRAERQAGLN